MLLCTSGRYAAIRSISGFIPCPRNFSTPSPSPSVVRASVKFPYSNLERSNDQHGKILVRASHSTSRLKKDGGVSNPPVAMEVGSLHFLNEDGEIDRSIPPLPIREGLNEFGRNDSAKFTKQVSRKHISITALPRGGGLEIAVEGPNPIVIRSGADKKKLSPKMRCILNDGDVVEFIPQQLPFKYISSAGNSAVQVTNASTSILFAQTKFLGAAITQQY
jgi:hypothetical protein